MTDVGRWTPVEQRGRVMISCYEASGAPNEVMVVTMRGDQDARMELVIGEYARDLALRIADGWTLITMTMYPIGHHAGAGYPGMDLDKALVVATYRRGS